MVPPTFRVGLSHLIVCGNALTGTPRGGTYVISSHLDNEDSITLSNNYTLFNITVYSLLTDVSFLQSKRKNISGVASVTICCEIQEAM